MNKIRSYTLNMTSEWRCKKCPISLGWRFIKKKHVNNYRKIYGMFFLWEFELQNFKRYIDNCTKSVCGVYERNLFLLWKVAYFWMQSVGCIFFKKVAFKRNVLKQTFDVVNGLTTHHAFRCQKSPENSSMQPLETYVFWLLSDYLPCGLLAPHLTSLHQTPPTRVYSTIGSH
jgi:hypothetical protein